MVQAKQGPKKLALLVLVLDCQTSWEVSKSDNKEQLLWLSLTLSVKDEQQ